MKISYIFSTTFILLRCFYSHASFAKQNSIAILQIARVTHRKSLNDNALSPLQLLAFCNDNDNEDRRAFLTKTVIFGMYSPLILHAEESLAAPAMKTLDMDMPTYDTISSVRSSKSGIKMEDVVPEPPKEKKPKAPRAPKSNRKLNDKAEEDEKDDDRIVTIDMSLPSYDENSKSGKNKSVFSI